MIRPLLSFFLAGLATIVAVGVGLSLLGGVLSMAAGLASLLLFKVAPILLAGWVAVKLFERLKRRDA